MPASSPRPDAVLVAAAGMVSSLGHDARSACAAARAGLSRARRMDVFTVKPEGQGPEGVVANPVRNVTPGFEGFGRLLALVDAGMRDLLRDVDADVLGEPKLGVYLSVPEHARVCLGEALVADEDIKKKMQVAAAAPPDPEAREQGERLLDFVIERCGGPPPTTRELRADGGHCGFAAALEAALEALRGGRIDRALVGCVDSLLDEGSLQWLLDTNRLKHGEMPAGLQPGEASAFVLLDGDVARGQAREPRVVVADVATGQEPSPLLAGKPGTGAGLAQAVLELLGKSRGNGDAALWLMADQNGEPYRAHEWGCALVKLSEKVPDLGRAPLWLPASAFGDTGVASGGVSFVWALEAFRRRYRPAKRCLIVSSEDGSGRAAVLLQGPD